MYNEIGNFNQKEIYNEENLDAIDDKENLEEIDDIKFDESIKASSIGMSVSQRHSDNHECNVIAKCVDHCLKENRMATFNDPLAIARILKKNDKKRELFLGEYKNTVIFDDLTRDFIGVRFGTNDPEDALKFVITEVRIDKSGASISGSRRVGKMRKDYYRGKFVESSLSKCDISSVDFEYPDFFNADLSDEQKELYRYMQICANMFKPVMKAKKKLYDQEKNDQELLNMLDEIREESRKIAELRSKNI